MKEYLNVLRISPLFENIERKEAEKMLDCLGVFKRRYSQDEFILRAGDETELIGLVLDGGVYIVREDFWGNRNIISRVVPGQVFGEGYACTPGARSVVSIIAVQPTVIMYMNVRRVLTTCPSACPFHTQLIRNLLSVLSRRTLELNEKLMYMTQRSTREKLLAYLSAEAGRSGGAEFDIPFDRQQLADYLSVERSAMSAELGRLKREGVLDFKREHFLLKDFPKEE